jgi:hypothetical protein
MPDNKNRKVCSYNYPAQGGEITSSQIRRWFAGGIARYRGIQKIHTRNLLEAICFNSFSFHTIYLSGQTFVGFSERILSGYGFQACTKRKTTVAVFYLSTTLP